MRLSDVRNNSRVTDEPISVVTARRLYQRTLAAWASDLLVLRRHQRQQDWAPPCAARERAA